MDQALKERWLAYGFLVVFVAILLWFGSSFARLVALTMDTSFPARPLIVGAIALSLATIAPLVQTFRVSAAGDLLGKLRARAEKSGKRVTIQTAGRTLSMYVVALAATPMFYGMALVFLIGDFTAMLLMLPATVILAIVGWILVGRLIRAMGTMFVQ